MRRRFWAPGAHYVRRTTRPGWGAIAKNLAFAKARERAHEPTAKKYAWVYSG
ncbi:MAG: hypothetical protein QOH18_1342 [Solirubrobacterales bacterium]|nr:hypothetical protein [Solirubrobacterales bacterium]